MCLQSRNLLSRIEKVHNQLYSLSFSELNLKSLSLIFIKGGEIRTYD